MTEHEYSHSEKRRTEGTAGRRYQQGGRDSHQWDRQGGQTGQRSGQQMGHETGGQMGSQSSYGTGGQMDQRSTGQKSFGTGGQSGSGQSSFGTGSQTGQQTGGRTSQQTGDWTRGQMGSERTSSRMGGGQTSGQMGGGRTSSEQTRGQMGGSQTSSQMGSSRTSSGQMSSGQPSGGQMGQPSGSVGGQMSDQQVGQMGGRSAQQSPITPVTVRDVAATNVVTTEPDAPLTEVVQKMRREDVGSVVVTEGSRPVGIVTDRKVALALGETQDVSQLRAADVMSEDLVTVPEGTNVFDLVRRLSDKGVRRVPVVGDQGDLKGIVSLDDVFVLLAEEFYNVSQIIRKQSPRF